MTTSIRAVLAVLLLSACTSTTTTPGSASPGLQTHEGFGLGPIAAPGGESRTADVAPPAPAPRETPQRPAAKDIHVRIR
jgi:hypothetical protein